MLRAIIFATVASFIFCSFAKAQEDGPTIIPERLQKIALTTPLADRLHVKWGAASPENIGQYMGLLAAVNQVAIVVAMKNGRETPSDEDYFAGLAAWCLFPNKPPIAESYWPKAYGAFGNDKVRSEIRAAVGPLVSQFPAFIAKGEAQQEIDANWPKDPKMYFSDVLDLGSLSDVK
ncbi:MULTISPECIES: hypothetical protein [unclassified Mesorhizobium]|uniref:hypothetical protein n=1 Tax=unclassified Mesorhizobium TaxID=325217 RepID=UPI0003CE69E7|nr:MULTISPECIES: hypothetical protein [unclassified Mesorhizobium]ESY22388.1 hypothetical protein X751_05680 [Mesorhizobium sp. LNJC395A00]WJI72867.1 hypothetical protein NLY37_17680 [Mesorhizobium sp. C395A]